MTDNELLRGTLEVAERVTVLLRAEGVSTAVIGALALAAHRYPRATADLDLATATDPFTTLRKLVDACRNEGWTARLITPDADDAGGPQSTSDVAELLARNPEQDLDAIAEVCERFGLLDDFSRLRDATLGGPD